MNPKPIFRLLFCLVSLITASSVVFAHDDEDKPKKPTKAQKALRQARLAMDIYKLRLTKEGS